MINETLNTLKQTRDKLVADIHDAETLRLKLIATIDQKQRELAALDAAIETVSRVNASA